MTFKEILHQRPYILKDGELFTKKEQYYFYWVDDTILITKADRADYEELENIPSAMKVSMTNPDHSSLVIVEADGKGHVHLNVLKDDPPIFFKKIKWSIKEKPEYGIANINIWDKKIIEGETRIDFFQYYYKHGIPYISFSLKDSNLGTSKRMDIGFLGNDFNIKKKITSSEVYFVKESLNEEISALMRRGVIASFDRSIIDAIDMEERCPEKEPWNAERLK